MKKLLLTFIALLTLTSCSNYQYVKTPLDWCISEVAYNTKSIEGFFNYTYTELYTNCKEESKEIIKGYYITTYCYEENLNDFVKTEWICGIGFSKYYGFYERGIVHIKDIVWIDCDIVEKTICSGG